MEDQIKIIEIIVDGITLPPKDRPKGSYSYSIPFKLSRTPDDLWKQLFDKAWKQTYQHIPRHKPDIASIEGDVLTLDRTTIAEFQEVHMKVLKLVLAAANEGCASQASELQEESDSSAN